MEILVTDQPEERAVFIADLVLAASSTAVAAEPSPSSEPVEVTMLADGTVFDASRDRGTPLDIRLGSGTVIQGWEDGLEYLVELQLDGDDTTISIERFADGTPVVSGTISDGVLPPGAVGSLDASQVGACNGFWTTSCL